MTFRMISRRAVLRGSGATIALPWLEAMRCKPVGAAEQPPKRFLVVASVLGTYPEQFWPLPKGTPALPADYKPQGWYTTGLPPLDDPNFELSPIAEPLRAYRSDLTFIEGLEADVYGGHSAYCGYLSGHKIYAPAGVDGGGEVGSNGISVDQHVAKLVGSGTRIPALQLGVGCSGSGMYSCLSWYDARKPAPAEQDPYQVWKRLFGDGNASMSGAVDAAKQQALSARRKSILDATITQTNRLSGQLGASDRQKLQDYLSSIRELEQRLAKLTPERSCNGMEPPKHALDRDAEIPAIASAQADLLAMAFACDLTRVATFQLGFEGSNQTYPWLNISDQHHDLSHTAQDSPERRERYDRIAKITRWDLSVVAGILDRLKAIPEGQGTVYDNTVVLWLNTLTLGCQHSNDHVPLILISKNGKYFRSGRHIRYPNKPGHKLPVRRLNDLYVPILRSFGADVRTFGDPALHGDGGLCQEVVA